MELTFEQVDFLLKEGQKQGLLKGLNVQDFSRAANQLTGTEDFRHGDTGAFGATLKRGSVGLDNFLQSHGCR